VIIAISLGVENNIRVVIHLENFVFTIDGLYGTSVSIIIGNPIYKFQNV